MLRDGSGRAKETGLKGVMQGVKHAARGDIQEARSALQPLLDRQSSAVRLSESSVGNAPA